MTNFNVYDEVYDKFDSRGEKIFYKMAKSRQAIRKDLIRVKCVKDKNT